MAKRARLTDAEEKHEEEEQHRYIIGEEKRENVDSIILKKLSMDARTPLSEIAKEAKVSKTTVFHELNRLVAERGVHFVPEINLKDMWQRELVYSTKRSEKRQFRELKIHSLGFSEYFCFVRFTGTKPTDEQILKAIEKSRNSYTVQYCCKLLEAKYDTMIYIVARTAEDVDNLLYDFSLNLPPLTKAYRYVFQVRKWHGYFPILDNLINQFKISDRYKKMLLILNQNARGELSKMGMKKDMVTYLYRALLDYGIIHRSSLYMEKPSHTILGIVRYIDVDTKLWEKNIHKWYKRVIEQKYSEGSYIYAADVLAQYGVILVIGAKDPIEFDRMKNELGSEYGLKPQKSILIARSLLGNLGTRNFDMQYSEIYGKLAQKGLVKRIEQKERTRLKSHRKPEFFDLEG